MRDDLISRRSLIIRLKNGSVIPFSKMLLNDKHKQILEFEDMVKTQPTAYDVEKVIQQLEENKEKTIHGLRGLLRGIPMAKALSVLQIINEYMKEQIEIVKSGGIAVGQKGGTGMSREILFRGKRTDTKEWIEGNYITDEQNPHKAYIGYLFGVDDDGTVHDTDIVEVDPETVCQYTGLTDKNGRKIFEGDIVRYTDEVIGKEKVDEVEYNETHAAFCRLHRGKMGLQYLFIDEAVANRCEVIGNIFYNPELLNQ